MISVIIIRFMIIGRVCGLKTGMNIAKNKKPRYAGLLLKSFGWGLFQQHHLPGLNKLTSLNLI
jgi:hypothetical protein